MRQPQSEKTLHLVCAAFALLLVGCAANRTREPVLASRYYGAWTNLEPRYYNWWVISAAGVVNYGIALDGGKCGGRSVTVLSSDQIDIQPPNGGTATLRVAEGNLLLLLVDDHFAVHKRVKPSDICRKPDGSYFEGAPYPSP
jgi:hypothetical protein